MALSLVAGVMDGALMAAVAAAVCAERLLPAGERVARATGVALLAVGAALLARAAR